MKRMKPDTKFVENFGYIDIRTGKLRTRWWTKARVPGTPRVSRMPGGSGYRGDRAQMNFTGISYRVLFP